MRRREFIKILGGTAAAWPVAARAQAAIPVIGYLSSRSPDDTVHLVAAFRQGLHEIGFVEGQNIAIEYRWAFGQYDRLPPLAAELVGRSVNVIVATGGDPAAIAAKAAIRISSIPLIFAIGSDPVKLGLTTSYNQPGGNATGIHSFTSSLEAKRIGLLHELVASAATIGYLMNPNYAAAETQLADAQGAARALRLETVVLKGGTDTEIDAAFDALARQRIMALAVAADPFFDTRRAKLVALAGQYAVPASYHSREYAAAGGLMSYGISFPDVYRQVGVYTGRILTGVKPVNLPVMQPTKFEFVINLRVAKSLGLEVPSTLLASADEVIE